MAPSCQDRPGLAWRLGEAIVIFVKPFRIFWQLPCFQRICCRAKMSVTSRPFWQKVSAHTICCVRRKIAPRLLGIRCAYKVVSTPGMDEYYLQMRFQGVRLEVVETPPHVVLEDYPLVRDRPELAADELGRLAALGTIL